MFISVPSIVIKQENDSQFYDDELTYVKHDEEESFSEDVNYKRMMLDVMDKKRDIRELLIQLIREEPRLWDHRNKAYHNQDIKSELWASIAKKLNLSDVEVKNKWQILRSNYMREKRRLKTIPSGASEAHNKATVYWTFFSMMSFLDDSSGMRRKSRIVKRDSGGLDNSTSCKLENLDEGVNSCATEDTNSQSDIDLHEHVRIPNLNERIIRQSSLDEELDVQYFKQLENNDPDLLFFKSLMPQIKQLDSSQNLSFKVEVAQLLLSKLQTASQTSSITPNIIESRN